MYIKDHTGSRSGGDAFTEIVAECWFYDGCVAAAAAVRHVCADVYLHPTLVEVHCPPHTLDEAAAVLSQHIAVDHIEVKSVAAFTNFGGRAIIGAGTTSSTPKASRVLSTINVTSSIIAVADSGIDMNNCFFYDANVTSAPWNSSRVVESYNALPCEFCGRCCGSQSGPACTNASNTCGNYIDESAHGTHVAGICSNPKQIHRLSVLIRHVRQVQSQASVLISQPTAMVSRPALKFTFTILKIFRTTRIATRLAGVRR
jgi:hypothetical protein